MSINLLGIKTSPASGALFRAEWRCNKVSVMVFIGEIFCTWLLLLLGGGLIMTCVTLTEPAVLSPDQIVPLSLGIPWSVFSSRLAIAVGLLAVPVTILRTLHHFYIAAELGFHRIVDYDISRDPLLRRHIDKCQQRDPETEPRNSDHEGNKP